MAIGVYCENCKHKELEPKFDKWPCMDCCDGDRRDPFTNADRIRAMSDEELADYLRYYSDSYAKYDMDWLDWLRQEVDDG